MKLEHALAGWREAEAQRDAIQSEYAALEAENARLREEFAKTLDTFDRWIRKKMWDEDAAKSWITMERKRLKPAALAEIKKRRAALNPEHLTEGEK